MAGTNARSMCGGYRCIAVPFRQAIRTVGRFLGRGVTKNDQGAAHAHNIFPAHPSTLAMAPALAQPRMLPQQNQQIAETVGRERKRLRAFIRRRVFDEGEAEDILQDVLYELVVAYRQLQPLEEAGAWLFRVARNRITDMFRRKRPVLVGGLDEPPAPESTADPDAEPSILGELLLLPAAESPDALLARELLLERLAAAIEELPAEQREVFVAHEIEAVSFKEMAARTGVPLNTLLARKHYAVKHLRRQLQGAYDEWNED